MEYRQIIFFYQLGKCSLKSFRVIFQATGDERSQNESDLIPLFCTLLSQPYLSFSLVSRNHKMQVSFLFC